MVTRSCAPDYSFGNPNVSLCEHFYFFCSAREKVTINAQHNDGGDQQAAERNARGETDFSREQERQQKDREREQL